MFRDSISIIKVNNHNQYIDIENDGCMEQDQNMSGWVFRRDPDRKTKIIYKFPENFRIKSQSTLRIYFGKKPNTDEDNRETIVNEGSKPWDVGSHIVTYLIDNNNEERASIVQTCVSM